MRTTKPISTISFNSPEYLRIKLDELTKAKKVSFWAAIPHKGEDDEGGKKDHIHVYVEPAKMIQTDDLRAELQEFDPSHPDKPLGTLTWRTSRFDEWYLYGLHDRAYLASKGLTRHFHYTPDDFMTSDPDDLTYHVKSIDRIGLSPYSSMMDAIDSGLSWSEYFGRGLVPVQQIKLFEAAWYLLVEEHERRKQIASDGIVNPITGEVVDRSEQRGRQGTVR